MARFSEHFTIVPTEQDDWFDLVLEQDTPLFIDPYLVFQDDDPRWSSLKDRMTQFFELACHYVLQSGGVEDTAAWKKAVRLLKFPEPKEFSLGMALGSPDGAGAGEVIARSMIDVLNLMGLDHTQHLTSLAGFSIFSKGIGRDRISDILCNVLKADFIRYTQEVSKRHDIVVRSVQVRNAKWDERRGRWLTLPVDLPIKPSGNGVLLTPGRFLRDIPSASAEDF
ncbi:MAG: hypothetical protein ACRC35_02555 [Angustibacter sp.]